MKQEGDDVMSMNKKRLTALALGGAMLCTMSVTALAADRSQVTAAPAADDAVVSTQEFQAVDHVLYFGTLKELVRDDQGKLTALLLGGDLGEYQMNLSDETLWVDSTSRTSFDPEGLKVGEKLYVFYSAAATLSIPPQSSAIVVVRNVDEHDAAAMYHEVEAVTKRDDGELVITTDKGGLYITVSADASVVDYAGQKLSLDQVKAGSRIMAWYSVVLESYPAQTGTSRLLLLPDAKTEPQEGAALPLTLAGKTVDFTARYESSTAMVPVAAVAKELGLDVTYTPDTGDGARVTLADSDFEVTLYIDRSVVSGVTRIPGAVGATGPLNYHKAPYIVAPGTTWAPAEIFQMLGKTVEVGADGVKIG